MNVHMTPNGLLARMALPIAATAVLASACSSSSGSSGSGGGKATAPPRSSAAANAPAASLTVQALRGRSGRYLTDGSGRSLYLFASDTGATTTCTGACATEWPPLIATGSVTAASGASMGDLATIDRPDGTKQVTYGGHPLYYFAGDEKPGTTEGQGIDDFGALWWLVAPSGQKITASASGSAASGGGSVSGGY